VRNDVSKSKFGKPIPGSLSTIIGSFKSAVTKAADLAGRKDFGWHGRFFDHIIRDGKDLDRIRKYILDNPANWVNDDNFSENIGMDRVHTGEED